MKKTIAAFIIFVVLAIRAATPTYNNFAPADFTTNNFPTININPSRFAFATLDLGYEIWYEPFQGAGSGAGVSGSLGWTGASGGAGGGGIAFSNAVGHAGTIAIQVSSSANSIHSIFNSTVVNSKPTIPPLNATTGWTNLIVWRINGTNSLKGYLVLQAGNLTQAALEAGMGIFVNTTNSNQIMGHCSSGSSVSTTNLGTLQDGVWYTNMMWSATAGVISFNLNGGPEATLSANVTSSALTPQMGLVKTVTGVAASLEVDLWVFLYRR